MIATVIQSSAHVDDLNSSCVQKSKERISVKEYYEILISGVSSELKVKNIVHGISWIGAELSDGHFGIAMNTEGDSYPRMTKSLIGLSAKEAAACVMSWNMQEASEAMAVINAFYNTAERMRELSCCVPYERICTCGMDIKDKTVGFIGHLKMPADTTEGAKAVHIIERSPKNGDLPDSACEYILPECDIVIITGSASVNKTMPRLLELSESAETIVVGPTTPLCPELLGHGISRLSGMVVRDKDELIAWMSSTAGSPYKYGDTFLCQSDN